VTLATGRGPMGDTMTRSHWLLGGLLLGLCSLAARAQTTPPPPAPAPQLPSVTVTVSDGKGTRLGEIRVTETPHGLLLQGTLTGVPPGEHAIHVHETGKCEPPFKTAGGHFNPGKKDHGALLPSGAHAGDLPNVFAAADGTLKFELLTPDLTLAPGPNSVFDADGSSIVLHAKADDYRSQPAGDSGDRIACGVLFRR
jgi:superoxide dismutase, Cu-Zn family